jgi:hypothetical protein
MINKDKRPKPIQQRPSAHDTNTTPHNKGQAPTPLWQKLKVYQQGWTKNIETVTEEAHMGTPTMVKKPTQHTNLVTHTPLMDPRTISPAPCC